jgi:hypothetical protein
MTAYPRLRKMHNCIPEDRVKAQQRRGGQQRANASGELRGSNQGLYVFKRPCLSTRPG